MKLTPKPSTINQSRPECPVTLGRAIKSKITAEVTSRSQTIAVGGTRSNRSLAIAAPTWTETIPVITSQTAGIRFVRGTELLCQTYAAVPGFPTGYTACARHPQRQITHAAGGVDKAKQDRPRPVRDAAGLLYRELVVGGFRTFVEAFDDAAELHRRYVRGGRTRCAGEGERVL